MPTIEAVSPTLGREASQPTTPSTPGIPYGRPSIVSILAVTPHPSATNARFLSARNGMAPRRKEFGLLEILIQHPLDIAQKRSTDINPLATS